MRLLPLCIPFLSLLFYITPLSAQEIPAPSRPPRNIKGFVEVGLSIQYAERTVVEEIGPGENFEGTAASTRVLAKVATRPFWPAEIYLQAGTANLHIEEFNDFRGDYRVAYGGGVALTIYEAPRPRRYQVIVRGDGLTFKTEDHVLTTIGGTDVFVKEIIRWNEYTIDGIWIWRTQYWEPYVGGRFSWLDSSDTIKDPAVGKLDLEEDINIGFVLGTNLYFDPRENFALNFEITLIDKNSLGIGLKLWY